MAHKTKIIPRFEIQTISRLVKFQIFGDKIGFIAQGRPSGVHVPCRIPTVKLKIPGKLLLKSDPELLLHSSYSF